ncbi:uncharacterized protein LOC133899487 [Phragmites australis]|uniref:uncharacterized protein LOC133899487 n=1 Tax=Phragmites australis TaxID=29695 RepID=UPI002D764C19|nr:uncharacterized protein LOC133899487 [Phragmites australis]
MKSDGCGYGGDGDGRGFGHGNGGFWHPNFPRAGSQGGCAHGEGHDLNRRGCGFSGGHGSRGGGCGSGGGHSYDNDGRGNSNVQQLSAQAAVEVATTSAAGSAMRHDVPQEDNGKK